MQRERVLKIKNKKNNGQAPNSIFRDRKRPVAKLNSRQEGRKSRQNGYRLL